MSLFEYLDTTGPLWGAVVVSTIAVYTLVVLLTRLAGPRSLATLSSFDFAATIAVGSTMATTAVGSTSLAEGAAGLLVLFGLQAVVAVLRRRGAFSGLVDNRPALLMAGSEILDDRLRHARITREEMYGRLRSAGVHELRQVHAVVLETTGDLSVLTADRPVDAELLAGVRGVELLV